MAKKIKTFNLKFFDNRKRSKATSLNSQQAFLELKKIEATVVRELEKVFKGRVKVACFETSESELGYMSQVLSSEEIQSKYRIQQEVDNPLCFRVARRELI